LSLCGGGEPWHLRQGIEGITGVPDGRARTFPRCGEPERIVFCWRWHCLRGECIDQVELFGGLVLARVAVASGPPSIAVLSAFARNGLRSFGTSPGRTVGCV